MFGRKTTAIFLDSCQTPIDIQIFSELHREDQNSRLLGICFALPDQVLVISTSYMLQYGCVHNNSLPLIICSTSEPDEN